MIAPIKSGDHILITVSIKRLGDSSMTLQFEFFEEVNFAQGKEIAKGEFSIVSCVHDEKSGKLRSTKIEQSMKSKILEHQNSNEK
jgi:acyl-CoA thioesterase FadM